MQTKSEDKDNEMDGIRVGILTRIDENKKIKP